MTSQAPLAAPARGNTLPALLIAGLAAFLLGLAVMAAIFRFSDWGAPAPAPAQPQPVAPATAALPTSTDVATLAAREQALAARLDALDARLRATDSDARTAGSYAGRAEAMMLISAARRAIERGQALGFVGPELRARFGAAEPQAVATVLRAAGEPVTLEDLRFALDQIAPRLSTAAPGGGWLDAVRRELGSLVIIRKESAPSPHPRERLQRARRLLAQGHVEASLAEINRLPGAQGAESWMAAASRYVETRRALDTLEAAAIQGRAAPGEAAPTA
ncbi:hypothetical protein [Sphingomonas turrisvirgatae]|uniref:Inner membrane protein n=1 Tax=Sphingomonas turrisvirgatae TaxID=1888892 RepID=A0A1E3LSZ1_9SPHN|nr:hypothetical protein [Sphingomonas turrisvirgatae]ODP35940.1 hypothetical protein BFL28_07550 [Sphingomonas turrisvirgatae]